jgi:hypothetical protein
MERTTKGERVKARIVGHPQTVGMTREAMRCPECGETERFFIAATVWAEVYPDEVCDIEDIEWDDSSVAMCGNCYENGTVSSFNDSFEAHILELRTEGEEDWSAMSRGEAVYTTPIDPDE